MSITDKLREYANGFKNSHDAWSGIGDDLTAIADRIDAEHERLMQEQPFTIDMVPMTDERMAEHGWVRLPKDADGEYIRIGDVLDPPVGCDDYVPLQVRRLTYDGYENEWYFDGEVGGFCGMAVEHMDVAGWTHHHYTPTVEDTLREFALRAIRDSECGMGDLDETCAEYASKLRLAEEVDG